MKKRAVGIALEPVKRISLCGPQLQEQFVSPVSLKFLQRPTAGNYAPDTPAPIRQWPLFFPTS
jgi:hypothetical protein